MAHFQSGGYDDQGRNKTDEYGNPVSQTDKYGNPVSHTQTTTFETTGHLPGGGYGASGYTAVGHDHSEYGRTGDTGGDYLTTGRDQTKYGTGTNYATGGHDQAKYGGTGGGYGSGGVYETTGGDIGTGRYGTTGSGVGTGGRYGTSGGMGTGYSTTTGGIGTTTGGTGGVYGSGGEKHHHGREEHLHGKEEHHGHEKKGIMDKIKENIPGACVGSGQGDEGYGSTGARYGTTTTGGTTGAEYGSGGRQDHHGREEHGHEKKGVMDKIKDKIPGLSSDH